MKFKTVLVIFGLVSLCETANAISKGWEGKAIMYALLTTGFLLPVYFHSVYKGFKTIDWNAGRKKR